MKENTLTMNFKTHKNVFFENLNEIKAIHSMTLLSGCSLARSKYIFQAYMSKTVYLVSAPNDLEQLKRLDIDNLQPKTKVT